MQVSAMARIPSAEQQEVANGTALLSVLRATAAPLGVTLLSVLVQARSGGHVTALAAQGLPRALAQREGTLLAMHDSFGLAVALSVGAIVLLWRVPRRGGPAVSVRQPGEDGALAELGRGRVSASR
jgi:hypothetical protein